MPRYSTSAIYDQPCRIATPEEKAAFEAGLPNPGIERAPSAPSILKALAPGAFHLFTQYHSSSQLGMAVQTAKRAGGTYTCSRELSLVDGACIGVRVTRVS